MNKIENLIQFIKIDIDLIRKGIHNDNPLLLKHIKKDKDLISITKECFIDLSNKYCFYPLPSNYNYFKGYVPIDRLELFQNIFLPRIIKEDIYTCFYAHGGSFFHSVERLYFNFFLEVFKTSIITTQKIADTVQRLLKDWEYFLVNQQFPVQIIFFLPEVFIENDIGKLTNDFEIRSIPKILEFEQQGNQVVKSFEIFGPFGSFLIFNTSISGNHNFVRESDTIRNIEKKDLIREWHEKLNKIGEIFLCFNLAGISFANEVKSYTLPWWFGERIIKFERKPVSVGKKKITDVHLKKIIKLLEHVKILDFSHDKELELALYKYSLLSKREFLYDMILDEFIILESIFTKGSFSEVSYRLSSNLAFFLAENFEDFRKIYDCIKDFYEIRSKIAHGEDWVKILSKQRIRRHLGIDDPNAEKSLIIKEVYFKLRRYIDRTVIKILNLKYNRVLKGENQSIMDDFKGTYFVENSFLNKKNCNS